MRSDLRQSRDFILIALAGMSIWLVGSTVASVVGPFREGAVGLAVALVTTLALVGAVVGLLATVGAAVKALHAVFPR